MGRNSMQADVLTVVLTGSAVFTWIFYPVPL